LGIQKAFRQSIGHSGKEFSNVFKHLGRAFGRALGIQKSIQAIKNQELLCIQAIKQKRQGLKVLHRYPN